MDESMTSDPIIGSSVNTSLNSSESTDPSSSFRENLTVIESRGDLTEGANIMAIEGPDTWENLQEFMSNCRILNQRSPATEPNRKGGNGHHRKPNKSSNDPPTNKRPRVD